MTLVVAAEPAPLETNAADGVVLVGKTRVTLDTLVAVFNRQTEKSARTHVNYLLDEIISRLD